MVNRRTILDKISADDISRQPDQASWKINRIIEELEEEQDARQAQESGLKSIEQTTTSTADGGVNVITATLADDSTSEFYIRNGSRGSQGPQGPRGIQGIQGEQGVQGEQGPSGTIAVGTTSTLPAGSSATVTNTGTSTSAIFNFGIPQGDKGDKGDPGDPGLSGTVGGPINPVYLNDGVITAANTQSSGNNYNIVPKVGADGVMDIGRYIDLHNSASGTTDYTTRIEANADGNLYIQGGSVPDVSVGTGISIRGANTKIGDLSSLSTTSKNNLVAAINEVDGVLDGVAYIGSAVGQATQLVDNEQNNIYPVAGSMMNNSITTAMLQDGVVNTSNIADNAVTPAKINLAPQSVGTESDIEVYYQIISGLVFLTVHSIVNKGRTIQAWSSANIGTLPSDARPKSQGFFLNGVALVSGSDAAASGLVVAVAGSGVVQLQNKSANAVTISRVHASGFFPTSSITSQ